MSATTEILVEQIKVMEEAIASANAKGWDSSRLEEDLRNLRVKLTSTVSMLNENINILKG